MAPDPRFALRSPKLGEPVVLFALADGITSLEEVSDAYPPALLSLVMGAFGAHADGTVSELEKRHLTERFESSAVLGPSEKTRLHANLNWMMSVPPDLGPLRRRLKDIDEDLRHGLGRLALAVVGADGVVDPAEVTAIEKLYRILGLETKHVYRELHALVASSEPVTVFRPQTSDPEYAIPTQPEGSAKRNNRTPIVLDQERVAAIMADTNHVSNVLHAVFSDDAAEAYPAEETEHTTNQNERFAGLDAKHRGFGRGAETTDLMDSARVRKAGATVRTAAIGSAGDDQRMGVRALWRRLDRGRRRLRRESCCPEFSCRMKRNDRCSDRG